ncbi:hypothetical protein BVD23_05450 [Salmonella enterica]|nr:hypothetical protein [Salmonella enterica]EDW4355369.1 fimbrial protein [Salmonella enterica subsp. salamae]HCM1881843.1 fimbrial protein [Salmonella enterica subsp. salamae serovar 60:z10:z39]EAX8453732.1 hypothetical protein [Salmonella enterica]EAX8552705.1 hypothetical protein [Salmonella enterica]
MKKIIAIPLYAAALATSSAYAANGSCTTSSGINTYTTDYSVDWTMAQNETGAANIITGPASGSGSYRMECSCAAKTGVNLYYAASTPLTNGHSTEYYKLNDNLDLKMQINNLPDGSTMSVPTLTSSAHKEGTNYYSYTNKNSVCVGDAESDKVNTPQISVGSDTTLTLYVTKPFLGELVIPTTHVATVQAAWSSAPSSPRSNYGDIAQIYLQGKITVPQSCKINQGDVIQVNLGFIDATRFTTKGSMPDGYTPVPFDIIYDCGDLSGIKNTLLITVESDDVVTDALVARRRSSDNVPDVGIKMTNAINNLVSFQGGTITVDPSGVGKESMHAFPVNLVGGQLEPGPFKGTATLTVIVK